MTSSGVGRRRVYHVGGYDHQLPEAAHGRFGRELRRFEQTWSASVTCSPPSVGQDLARWQIVSHGPNWQVETDYRLVRWDDVIATVGKRPLWKRILQGGLAFLDFSVCGALWGYFRTSWRYALFFLYPFLAFLLILALALAAGTLIGQASHSLVLGAAVTLSAVAALFVAADRWLYLGLLFDDWIFAREYTRGGDAVLDERLERVAAEIVEAARSGAAEEIVIVGHSLGAVLAIDLLDRAIKLGLRGDGARLALLTVGSSILKIGLHSAAKRFRAAAARVAAFSGLLWVDFQARSDVMNFYQSEPLRLMGLASSGVPVVRSVSLRRMVDPARYPRLRKNLYRLHCQFVRGNDRRAPYDYFMFVCGPLSAERQALCKQGAVTAIDTHGRFAESAG